MDFWRGQRKTQVIEREEFDIYNELMDSKRSRGSNNTKQAAKKKKVEANIIDQLDNI